MRELYKTGIIAMIICIVLFFLIFIKAIDDNKKPVELEVFQGKELSSKMTYISDELNGAITKCSENKGITSVNDWGKIECYIIEGDYRGEWTYYDYKWNKDVTL